MNQKEEKFNKILKNIKSIKIQGARNVAKAALKAYLLFPSKYSKHKLLNSRPTEPMMHYVLNLAEKKVSEDKIIKHFEESQENINKNVLKLISNKNRVFTHCHSTNVINSLIYSKKKGKKFEVYNTETRPLYQGRKTANELRKAGIKVTMFIDSAAAVALEKENNKDNIYVNKVFIGADALLKNGIINKIGSGMFSEIAHKNNIPVYIVADSWKFTKNKLPLEQRSLNEVWDKTSRDERIRIKNPAFEFVNKKYITSIITEHGLMKYDKFVRMMK
jgi:translation initiation factor 2B subunit (eIF-2B alpha/beta/delta family)